MKTIPTLFILSALATSFTLNAMPPEGRGGPPSRAEFIKRFDLDADGKLSKEERENARQAVKGEGTRPRGKRGQMRRVLIEEFDKDGDGKLSAMERKAVRQWRQETGKRPFSDGPPPPDGSENL